MKNKEFKFNVIAGLPRSSSTLLCQILSQDGTNFVTPTSPIDSVLRGLRTMFSQNVSFRTQNRLEIYEDFRLGMNGFLEGYFSRHSDKPVFDKSRGWLNSMQILDAVRGNKDTKIIWCWRNISDIVGSIEKAYQDTILLENMDESAGISFNTLDERISIYCNDSGIIGSCIIALRNAIEQGFGDRIMFVQYYELCTNPNKVLSDIHKFCGLEPHIYDFEKITQVTHENDEIYNHKFKHFVQEGKLQWHQSSSILPQHYIDAIQQRFAPFYELVLNGNKNPLLRIETQPTNETIQKPNPFAI
jgi:sulfotransferase